MLHWVRRVHNRDATHQKSLAEIVEKVLTAVS